MWQRQVCDRGEHLRSARPNNSYIVVGKDKTLIPYLPMIKRQDRDLLATYIRSSEILVNFCWWFMWLHGGGFHPRQHEPRNQDIQKTC